MAIVLFIVQFMEQVWTLNVLGGGSGGVGGGGSEGLDGGCVMFGWVQVLSLHR